MHCKCSKAGGPQLMDSPRVARPINRSLKPVETEPMIGETPSPALDSWLTPNSVFYIRNHFNFPDISDSPDTDWIVSINGSVKKSRLFYFFRSVQISEAYAGCDDGMCWK
ncbi:hypothetical protein FIM09_05180 [SAR202 cluster bacterium AC-647-P02_OGT_505m]|nr:hypothetical protein [SAR202 cluster bacterium AC-647-P02_OGT_505m]